MGVNTTHSISGHPPKGTREPISAGTAAEAHTINTSEILEPPQMQYTDEESEVLTAVSASGWYASFSDGRLVPLVLWSVWDDGSVTGVVAKNGIDASRSAEDLPGFEGFVHKDNNKQGDT